MTIAIIGAGNVGSALARAFSKAGQSVLLGVRDTSKPEIVELARQTGATIDSPANAAAGADIVVLALPWRVAETAVRDLGPLAGKIVIDAMNPLAMTANGLALERGHVTSGAETVAGWLPQARVVKTLNQVGAEIMADAFAFSHPPAMLMAGDDAAAKAKIGALLSAIGFDAMDAGDLTKARILEPLALVWINQAIVRGKGRSWAFAAIDRQERART